ncbi:hypothetical protein V6N13_133682 [Hibiscus sabdariffa]
MPNQEQGITSTMKDKLRKPQSELELLQELMKKEMTQWDHERSSFNNLRDIISTLAALLGIKTNGKGPDESNVKEQSTFSQIWVQPESHKLEKSIRFNIVGASARHPIDVGVNYGYTQDTKVLDLNMVAEVEKIREEE